MRTIAAVAALFGLMAGAGPVSAEITYPWCVQYMRDGRNCGFSTYEQCRATAFGTGYCERNPMYVGPPTAAAPRRRR
jgi:Protein of unknown function (DUF3551)